MSIGPAEARCQGWAMGRGAEHLPIDTVLSNLSQRLTDHNRVVLTAPPGSGKTTRVPPRLLESDWLNGQRILLLEPRRIVARSCARYMANCRGEQVGMSVGYRTRMDSRCGPSTRIEVVTEGILTRLLQSDPELPGIGLIIFDEFHERNLTSDLGLALSLDVQQDLRPDLRLLVMSATLEAERVSSLLDDCPVLRGEGQCYPVETLYLGRPARIEDGVATAVRRAVAEEQGSVLCFLPGEREISRVEQRLAQGGMPSDVEVAPLYGRMSRDAQDAAIRTPRAGRRKVVLATSIAESSLTIDGIRVVVDGGLARTSRFDPRSGMSGLQTVPVSVASADQRRGRAGRISPGICYRLWSESDEVSLPAHTLPEILEADLAPLALQLAVWGVSSPADLRWLDSPPAGAYEQARDLLRRLGALDAGGRLTALGREMSRLGAHPRVARMLLQSRDRGWGRAACRVAAILEERDILPRGHSLSTADLRVRLDLLASTGEGRGHDQRTRRASALARYWERKLKLRDAASPETPNEKAGAILAMAYPERVASCRHEAPGAYRMVCGRGGRLLDDDPLVREPVIAIGLVDGRQADARIHLAAPIDFEDIEREFEAELVWRERTAWDSRREAVVAHRRQMLGSMVLREETLHNPAQEEVARALCDGIRHSKGEVLPWTRELKGWGDRVMFVRRAMGDGYGLPDVSGEALLDRLEEWCLPYLVGMRRLSDLKRLDLKNALESQLSHRQRKEVDRLAPTHWQVPSGSRIRIDYAQDPPVLAVKLQEMFGAVESPRVAGGRVSLLLHLLSPAGRPVQITQDLASFWDGEYTRVRGEMRGRYPRHPWPEDPRTASPTRRTKARH